MAHIPYFKRLNHREDFRVSYRFYSKLEGGRPNTPFQGYRSDFWYVHPIYSRPGSIFMIWPEFESETGDEILDDRTNVAISGTAKMWIVTPQMRSFHKVGIKEGIVGYFMEGPKKIAECEVIEILGLKTNPVSSKL